MLKKLILSAAIVAGVAGSACTLAAHAAADADGARGPSHRMGERGFLLDAKLAGMKAALSLNPDQEKLWSPFESAVRDAAKDRREAMRQWRERADDEARPSPIERMNRMSDRLAKASQDLKEIADAAKPLYDSLDDGQKDRFGPLLRMLRD